MAREVKGDRRKRFRDDAPAEPKPAEPKPRPRKRPAKKTTTKESR